MLFLAIEFYNEADTLESSSILIYSQSKAGLCTQWGWHDAVQIKMVKIGGMGSSLKVLK